MSGGTIPQDFKATNASAGPILTSAGNTYRDPTNIVLIGGTYYVFFSRIAGVSQSGYAGQLYYATASDIDGTWTAQGLAVDRGAGGSWNDKGVMTPQVVVDGSDIYIFATGVPTSGATSPFQEGQQIGSWHATNPAGPWTANANNPILTLGAASSWNDALLDEAMPILINGRKRLYFKGRTTVSGNARNCGFATPDDGTWGSTSWTMSTANPLAGTGGMDSMCLFNIGDAVAGFADDEQRELQSGNVDFIVGEPNGFDNRHSLATLPSWASADTTGVGLYQPSPGAVPIRLIYHALNTSSGDLGLTIATLTPGRN